MRVNMLLAKLFSEIAAFHNEIYNINYDARNSALPLLHARDVCFTLLIISVAHDPAEYGVTN